MFRSQGQKGAVDQAYPDQVLAEGGDHRREGPASEARAP
jgi:hypothetical protein